MRVTCSSHRNFPFLVDKKMPNPLAIELNLVRDSLVAGETGADSSLYKLIKRLMAADPEEALTADFDSRTERCLIAGWTATRLAWLSRQRSDIVFVETAATLIASLAERPHRAAAFALLLERWPTSLPRLAVACRERINGTGDPNGWTDRTLSSGQQRVALAYEAARRLSMSQGKLASVVERFEQEAEQGYWDMQLVALLPAALAGVSLACDDRRLEPVRARSYRFSSAHQPDEVARPHQRNLEDVKRRQQIAGRHAGYNPAAAMSRGGSNATARRRGGHE